MFQFNSGICSSELPNDFFDTIVSVSFPCSDFNLHGRHVCNPTIETLSFEHAEFDLRHIEPATMLWSVMNIQSFRQASGLLGFKGLIERNNVVRIQIVHNQPHLDGIRITFVKHLLDLLRPILSGTAFSDCYMACSDTPEGCQRWTVRLLADKAVELKFASSVSHMTVQRILKKTNLSLTLANTGKFRPKEVRPL